jgi:predicted Zn-dependent protease
MSKRLIVRFTVFILIAGLASSCAINPVTGRKQLSLISEHGEIEMGKETDAQIAQEYGFYADKELTAYVTKIGMTMAPLTHRPKLEYHFAVLDTPVVNAFAAPGGYIYVTRGILAMMNSESELATVIGHELGHVNARHSVVQMSKVMLAQVGLIAGSILSKDFAKYAGVASLGMQLLFLKFSRDDEREADKLGVDYARAGRFNSVEMIHFFTTLQRYGDLSGGHNSLPGFLSTHPLTSERIENVKKMVGENDLALPTNRPAYLRQIDGIVYGDDPRQGFVEGGSFHHPGLGFSFTPPQGWEVQNTPTQVTMAGDNGNAAIIFGAEASTEDVATYGRNKIAKIEGRQDVSEQSATINGMSSFHQLCTVVQQNQDPVRARLAFIRKGKLITAFTAMSKVADFGRYDPSFRNVIGSFRDLTDAKLLNRQPRHLGVVRADGRRSYREYFEQSGAAKDAWPALAVLNGAEKPEAVPSAGAEVKVVR